MASTLRGKAGSLSAVAKCATLAYRRSRPYRVTPLAVQEQLPMSSAGAIPSSAEVTVQHCRLSGFWRDLAV
jgi:hypothetical protein